MKHEFSSRPTDDSAKQIFPIWGGQLTVNRGGRISLIDGVSSPVWIVKAIGNGGGGYHRSAKAVRKYERSYHTLNFVDSGEIEIFNANRNFRIPANALSIAKNSQAYHTRFIPDHNGAVQAFTMLIPDHLLAVYFPRSLPPWIVLSTETQFGLPMRQLIEFLFEHGRAIPSPVFDSVLRAFFELLVASLEDNFVAESPKRRAHDKIFILIDKYVKDNLADPSVRLSSMAKELKLSPRYLSRILHSHETTFPNLVRKTRIQFSKKLLIEIDPLFYSISDIASLCGFTNPSHFAQCFKQEVGMTPMQFRRELAMQLTT